MTRTGPSNGFSAFFGTATFAGFGTINGNDAFRSTAWGSQPNLCLNHGPTSSRRNCKALDELPEAFRTPVILYYFEDFSYRDIAEQMDLPMGTVMSRLARGKAFLRTRLLEPVVEELADAPRRAKDGL